MRVLRVKGVGEVLKNPDLIVVIFKIISKNIDYDQAMNDLNRRTVILRNDIVKAGFAKDDLKTTNFAINTEYIYKDGKNVFVGYIAEHDLKLSFDYNQLVLNNLLRIITKSEANPLFNVFFEVKDKVSFKALVLKDAVFNAKANASVIASSAGIKLGKILNINYDYQEIVYRSQAKLENTMLSSSAIDIIPDTIKGTDTVHIEFEIEDII